MTTGAPALASTNSPVRTIVQGVFTDAVTGDPIAGACISLYRLSLPVAAFRNHRLARACADASGAYSVEVPLSVGHFAYLEAPGYGQQWYGGRADIVSPAAFTAGEAPVTTKNIRMKRATASFSAHVTRQDGSPAPSTLVQLVEPNAGTTYASLRTDANGDVTRTGLPAGDYRVRVSGAGYTAVQFYPGKTALADGAVVTLVAGETVSLSERFLPENPMPALPPLSTLSGTVRTPSGTPIAGATVTAMSSNSPVVFGTATTGADGTYTMNVLGGGGVIKVSAPGYATAYNTDDPLPVMVTTLDGTHDIVLRPGSGTLRGTLTDSVPGPIPAPVSMSVNGADGWGYVFAWVGYDGTFEVPNMPTGTYTLYFTPPGRPSQQISNVIVRDGEATTADARLLDPGRVRARIVDEATGQPIAGATVTALSSVTGEQVKTSDAQGYADFGDYWPNMTVTVSATHRPYHFASVPVTVTPASGATTDVTVRMRPGAVLAVPVSNVDPAASICADLVGPNASDGWTPADCETPKNGVLMYGPLRPGTFRAFLRPADRTITGAQWASDSGGTGEERRATVLTLAIGSTTTTPSQRFGAPGSITGKIIDPKTRQPVLGCVQFASLPTVYHDMGGCADSTGVYRIEGLGPYAWPLFFSSHGQSGHGSIWSGGATSRLDAKLVTVTSGGTATYNFAPGAAAWFDVRLPATAEAGSWIMYAYDAQTGDLAGTQSPVWLTIGPGPKLLQITYTDQGGDHRSCWMRRQAKLRDDRPSGVYNGGPFGHAIRISVVPGKNCLAAMPPIVRVTPAPGNPKPMNPGQPPMPRQEVSVAGRGGVTGAPSIAGAQPETFNELVRNSFDSALHLAIGALP